MHSRKASIASRLDQAPVTPFFRPHRSLRGAVADSRWPAIAAAMADLRERKRHSVRIVDADCGAGCLLLHALRYARALGFLAIEGRGVDGSPALIGRARAAAGRFTDPAIGVVFEHRDVVEALRDEHDFPAEIVLWRSTMTAEPGIADALRRAGERVIVGGRALLRIAA